MARIDLYDRDYQIEYGLDTLVIYYRGKETIRRKAPGLRLKRDLIAAAREILEGQQKAKYYSAVDLADELGVTRQVISKRMRHLIRGIHYFRAETTNTLLFTEQGRKALIENNKAEE